MRYLPPVPNKLLTLVALAPRALNPALQALVRYVRRLHSCAEDAISRGDELAHENHVLRTEMARLKAIQASKQGCVQPIATATAAELAAALKKERAVVLQLRSRLAFQRKAMEHLIACADADYEKATRLLTDTAVALKGAPKVGTSHSWEDLPYVAAHLRQRAGYLDWEDVKS